MLLGSQSRQAEQTGPVLISQAPPTAQPPSSFCTIREGGGVAVQLVKSRQGPKDPEVFPLLDSSADCKSTLHTSLPPNTVLLGVAPTQKEGKQERKQGSKLTFLL